jgi:TolB-like protein
MNRTGMSGRIRWWLVVVAVLSVMAAGCAKNLTTGGTASVITPDFFGIGEEIALQLNASLRTPVGAGKRLIMATVVDIDDLYATSRFGRTLTEALSTSLFRHGFGIVEIRKSTELLVKDKSGELMLSRDAKLLALEQEAGAILTGTYSLTPDTVIVNLKLIDAGSQDVLSVAGLEIQRSMSINHLLSNSTPGGMGDAVLSAYER